MPTPITPIAISLFSDTIFEHIRTVLNVCAIVK
jgi:hypothetical protein